LLKGRLWNAAKWSDEFRQASATHAEGIQEQFEEEEPADFVIERLSKRWNQVHQADTNTSPILRLVESRFEELVRKAEFAVLSENPRRECELGDLSDGQTWWSLTPNNAEELNSFFVAFTRAKQRAFFTYCRQRGLPVAWIERILAPAGLNRVRLADVLP